MSMQDRPEQWRKAWTTSYIITSVWFSLCHLPECIIIFLNCISRTSIAIIAMEKQYLRTVCYNLVMKSRAYSVRKLFPYFLHECFVHHQSDNNPNYFLLEAFHLTEVENFSFNAFFFFFSSIGILHFDQIHQTKLELRL